MKASLVNSIKCLKRISTSPSRDLPKNERTPPAPWDQITLTPKPDKDIPRKGNNNPQPRCRAPGNGEMEISSTKNKQPGSSSILQESKGGSTHENHSVWHGLFTEQRENTWSCQLMQNGHLKKSNALHDKNTEQIRSRMQPPQLDKGRNGSPQLASHSLLMEAPW